METDRMDDLDVINELTDEIIGAAIEVHRNLGPGLLESIYEKCLGYELNQLHISYKQQVPLPLKYKQLEFSEGYKIDLLVESRVVVEIKTVERILPVHQAQLLTYLKVGSWKVGLLLNFNFAVMKDGIKRMIL